MVTAVGLGLVLAFEPAEPNIMRRPPRAPDEVLLSPFLLWRVGLVSVLFSVGAFGMFAWAEARGLSHEAARTIVVNTIVVMEICYLFSVRYLHSSSATSLGVLGTPAVLLGVGGIVILQLVFTYASFMQVLFDTRSRRPIRRDRDCCSWGGAFCDPRVGKARAPQPSGEGLARTNVAQNWFAPPMSTYILVSIVPVCHGPSAGVVVVGWPACASILGRNCNRRRDAGILNHPG